jgi:hypothetical protein
VPAPPGATGGEHLLLLDDGAQGLPLRVVGLEVGETDLLGIHAMKMRPHYQPPYEEALPWRTTP